MPEVQFLYIHSAFEQLCQTALMNTGTLICYDSN